MGNTVWQDLRYAWRVLSKSPGFTAIAVLTLALGIGANTGIFSVLRQVLLQRLPVSKPEELVLLYSPGPRNGHVSSDEGGSNGSESFSYPMYLQLRDQNTVFEGLAALAGRGVTADYHGTPERADADLVSGNYFTTLRVGAAVGRVLLPEDTRALGGNPVVVLGNAYWKKRFGSDPKILNQTLVVNNQAMTIVGVTQAGFSGVQLGRVPDVYLPITMETRLSPTPAGMDSHTDYWIKLVGRLKPGMTQAQAAAALAPTYRALLDAELPMNKSFNDQEKSAFVARQLILRSGARGRPILEIDTKDRLMSLMGMVALVLLVTCANVAGLLTARGAARQKEISVRLSLGATRGRLIRLFLMESVLLSGMGAVLGLVLASWMSMALVNYASANEIADGLSSALNGQVLLFTVVLAAGSGILFGVAPAFQATRTQLAKTMKEQGGGVVTGTSKAGLRKVLVVAQVSLTLLLVTSAWGFTRSLYNLKNVDLGMKPTNVLQFAVAPRMSGYDQPRSLVFYRQLEDRIRQLPGVQSLSGVMVPLLTDSMQTGNISVEGESPDHAGTTDAGINSVGPGHFANMGIALLQGREFRDGDVDGAPKVVVVNENVAKKFFPKGDAVGHHMAFGGGNPPLEYEIVGVVQNSHHGGVKEDIGEFVYRPYMQEKRGASLTYYVRTAGDPTLLASAVRQSVGEIDASLPIFNVKSFEAQINQGLSGNRLTAILAMMFGGLAALLAAMGIYGLLAFTVTQRTREIGVRMALGAAPWRVARMILWEIVVLGTIGVMVGLPLAYGAAKLVSSQLYGVQAFGLASIGISLVALAGVTGVAAYAPARRATKIDPMEALRYE